MRASPWLPVLLLLALAAYLLPDANLPFAPPAPVTQGALPAPPRALPAQSQALFERSRPATVRVESVNPDTRNAGIGTGFFISAGGQVLTAYHVVSGGGSFRCAPCRASPTPRG
ncbi:hypothetical protein [Deinococcus multiflagellatus]|uniref:Serine protease n=1 Tax=Deinococcus multiflagellatus TaxID=1656887 RepID=A0ABW1ZJ20_9DEIO